MSGKKREKRVPDPDRMMDAADSIRAAAKKLQFDGASGPDDRVMYLDTFYAAPVLYALAVEIALKALIVLERKQEPVRCHNLLQLFEELSEGMREQLESSVPSYLHPPGLYEHMLVGAGGGLRKTLEFHQKAFMEWRYPYERLGAKFYPSAIDEVLQAIRNAYLQARRKE